MKMTASARITTQVKPTIRVVVFWTISISLSMISAGIMETRSQSEKSVG